MSPVPDSSRRKFFLLSLPGFLSTYARASTVNPDVDLSSGELAPMSSPDLISSVALRTQAILSSRGLSLSEVARGSRTLFQENTRFHIPPNLYHMLEHRGFSPSIHQLFVLSRLSNYRLVDWLAVFGLVLDDIPRLQAVLPACHTSLIDETIYDPYTWFLSFEQITRGPTPGSVRPLAEWLRLGPPRRRASAEPAPGSPILYAKIGSCDALAFPELLPGSIVRIVKRDAPAAKEIPTGPHGPIFLIEHRKGLLCSKLHVVERNRVVLCPTQLPFAHIEFELGKEARIMGTVDLEFRPTALPWSASVSRKLSQYWTPGPLESSAKGLTLDDLLRRARRRFGLTFREASARSRLIARALENPEYFCAAGSLSDYETSTHPPRHIHKMFSLCVLYSLSVWDFMAAAGLLPFEAGTDRIPDELMGRAKPSGIEVAMTRPPMSSRQHFAEFPYYFGGAAAELLQMPHLSIRDIFWMEGPRKSFHPYLADAAAVIIDRRTKRVTSHPTSPLWAQPCYILLGRDGNYICSSCSSEGNTLVMRPFSNGFDRPSRFRKSEEIEVIGRVVAILRRPSNGRDPSRNAPVP